MLKWKRKPAPRSYVDRSGYMWDVQPDGSLWCVGEGGRARTPGEKHGREMADVEKWHGPLTPTDR